MARFPPVPRKAIAVPQESNAYDPGIQSLCTRKQMAGSGHSGHRRIHGQSMAGLQEIKGCGPGTKWLG